VKGQAVQEFVAESQDRTRNALAKSNQAALRAWNEQLVNDQGLFQQYLIARLDCPYFSFSPTFFH